MIHRLMRCAAGVLVVAAMSWPALAEDSPIGFVSGPLAGAAARNAKHTEEQASDGGGIVRTDTATFSTRGLVVSVDWARLPGGYHWRDTDRIAGLSQSVQRWLKATGFTVVRGDRTSVNSFLTQYRIISLSGTGARCGVFDMSRTNHLIQGAVCAPNGGEVPLLAVLQGLSINNVIGP
ncbi:MAG: hypothetical protein JF625_26585 [Inquilinus limosus]|uniref:Toxin co-regulated pilus biosynthesis protein Q C-terminal domain-containing protein n=1 Tax=Inquilinus limosus TaxID=171674 RepID=A0A952FUX7_9PROT|nr:hypothetical protein [Inquilinus limosus]